MVVGQLVQNDVSQSVYYLPLVNPFLLLVWCIHQGGEFVHEMFYALTGKFGISAVGMLFAPSLPRPMTALIYSIYFELGFPLVIHSGFDDGWQTKALQPVLCWYNPLCSHGSAPMSPPALTIAAKTGGLLAALHRRLVFYPDPSLYPGPMTIIFIARG